MRHRKDDVKVVERHQFSGACRDPAVARLCLALRTVAVAARVKRVAEILAAAGAAIAMDAERCRAAALDSPDHFQLRPGNARPAAVEKAADPGAKDVGHLQYRPANSAVGSGADGRGGSRVSSGFGADRNRRVERCT